MNIEVTQSPVDNLYAGDFPRMTKYVTLKMGKLYKRGELLEFDTLNKAVSLVTPADFKAVLVNDTNAEVADKQAVVYTTGEFHLDECVYNEALNNDDIIETAHLRSVFFK